MKACIPHAGGGPIRPGRPTGRSGVTILAYANNHYSGYAPDTVKLFREYWDKKAVE